MAIVALCMPSYLRFGCMFVLLAICTGCSTDLMRTIDPEQPILLSKDVGIIVGSITGMQAEHYWELGAIPYGKSDGPISGWIESGSKMTNAFWHEHMLIPGKAKPDPGLEAVTGRVFALSLPAGSYALFPTGVKYKNPFVAIEPATFDVNPREIKYIGRIQFQACLYEPKNRRVWRGYINASVPSIMDMWAIDRELLLVKYPELSKFEIVNSTVDDRNWQGLADELESKIETNCRQY